MTLPAGWLYTSSDLHLMPMALIVFILIAVFIRWRGNKAARDLYALVVSFLALASLASSLMASPDGPSDGLINGLSFLIPAAIILVILFLPIKKNRP